MIGAFSFPLSSLYGEIEKCACRVACRKNAVYSIFLYTFSLDCFIYDIDTTRTTPHKNQGFMMLFLVVARTGEYTVLVKAQNDMNQMNVSATAVVVEVKPCASIKILGLNGSKVRNRQQFSGLETLYYFIRHSSCSCMYIFFFFSLRLIFSLVPHCVQGNQNVRSFCEKSQNNSVLNYCISCVN